MSRSKKVSHFMSPPRKMMPKDPESEVDDGFECDSYANLKFQSLNHQFIGAYDDLRELLQHDMSILDNKTPGRGCGMNGMSFPMTCNQFDLYQLQRAVQRDGRDDIIYKLLSKYHSSVTNAFEGFRTEALVFPLAASQSAATSDRLATAMEKFASVHLKSSGTVAAMSRWELASLACWLSWFPDAAQKLMSKNGWLDGVVSGLLSVLSSRTHEPQCLSLAVSCVSFLVEAHATADGVLTDSNISQLLKLLLSKAVYPSATSSDITMADDPDSKRAILASQQWEVTFCRAGLVRLLKIPRVLASEVAIDELFSFIQKWWGRLQGAVSGTSSGFETPGRVKKGTLPVLRCAIEVIADIHSTVPQMREFIRHTVVQSSTSSSGGSGGPSSSLSFLVRYIASSDPRTALAASALATAILTDLNADTEEKKRTRSSGGGDAGQVYPSLRKDDLQAIYSCAVERLHYFTSLLENEQQEASASSAAASSSSSEAAAAVADENADPVVASEEHHEQDGTGSGGRAGKIVGKKRTTRSSGSSSGSSTRAPLIDKTNNNSNKRSLSSDTNTKLGTLQKADAAVSAASLTAIRATIEPVLINYVHLVHACLAYPIASVLGGTSTTTSSGKGSPQLKNQYTEPHMHQLFVRLIDQIKPIFQSSSPSGGSATQSSTAQPPSPSSSSSSSFQSVVAAVRHSLRVIFNKGNSNGSDILSSILADDNIDDCDALEKFQRRLQGADTPAKNKAAAAAVAVSIQASRNVTVSSLDSSTSSGSSQENSSSRNSLPLCNSEESVNNASSVSSVDDIEGTLSTTLNLVRFSDRNEAEAAAHHHQKNSSNSHHQRESVENHKGGNKDSVDSPSIQDEDAEGGGGRRSLGMIFTPAHSKSRYINDIDLGNAESQYPVMMLASDNNHQDDDDGYDASPDVAAARFEGAADISGIGASQSPRYLACSSQISCSQGDGGAGRMSTSLLSPNILPHLPAAGGDRALVAGEAALSPRAVRFADDNCDHDAGAGVAAHDTSAAGGRSFNESTTDADADAMMMMDEYDDMGYPAAHGCILEFTPVDSIPPYAHTQPPAEFASAPAAAAVLGQQQVPQIVASQKASSPDVPEKLQEVEEDGNGDDGDTTEMTIAPTVDNASKNAERSGRRQSSNHVNDDTSLGLNNDNDEQDVGAVDRSSQSASAAVHPFSASSSSSAGRGSLLLPPICDLYEENPLHSNNNSNKDKNELQQKQPSIKKAAAITSRATGGNSNRNRSIGRYVVASSSLKGTSSDKNLSIDDAIAAESPQVAMLLARLRAVETELTSSRKECASLRQTRDDAHSRCNDLQDSLEQAQITISASEAKSAHQSTESAKLRSHIQGLQRDGESTAQALKQSEERRVSQEILLQEAWEKLAAMAKLEVATQLERDAAIESARKSDAAVLQLQDSLAARELGEVELNARVSQMQGLLQKSKEESSKCKVELLRTQEELQVSKTESASLSAQLQVLQIGLQGETARLRETSQELEEKKEELENTRDQLQEAKEATEEIQQRANELEAEADELRDIETQLKQDLADSETKTETMRAELRKHRELISMINHLSASADHASRAKARRLSLEAAAQLEEASSQCEADAPAHMNTSCSSSGSRRNDVSKVSSGGRHEEGGEEEDGEDDSKNKKAKKTRKAAASSTASNDKKK